MSLTKEQRFSVLSTILFMIAFTGVLLFFGFTPPNPPPQEEGILINFGDSENGSGEVEPMPNEEPVEEEVTQTPVTNTSESVVKNETEEEVVTQNFDQTAVIEERKKKEAEEKKVKEEVEEKKRNEELELQRIAEIEKKRIEEEERIKKENQQKTIDARTKNAFGKNTNGGTSGEGNTTGNGNMGDPNGDINSSNRTGGSTGGDGVSFSLNGRSSRSLPKPEYNSQSDGKVVVEVTVDQNGNVVKAVPGVKGTTTSDKLLYQAAEKAALKATFDVNQNAPPQQVGTITYIFRLQ